MENELIDLTTKLNYQGCSIFVAPNKTITSEMVVEDIVDLLHNINNNSDKIEQIFTTKEL